MRQKIIFLIATVLATSCCPNCKECNLTLKYEWRIPHNQVDIINVHGDNLIGSKRYYKERFVQYVKDSGHYVINKANGLITDSIVGFVPKIQGNKYLWQVGDKKENTFLFTTRTSRYTIAENFHGYKIIIQEWYKNIRQSDNTVYSVLIYKDDNEVSERCLPSINDFTFDNSSLYIYSNNDIYKFKFDDLIDKE